MNQLRTILPMLLIFVGLKSFAQPHTQDSSKLYFEAGQFKKLIDHAEKHGLATSNLLLNWQVAAYFELQEFEEFEELLGHAQKGRDSVAICLHHLNLTNQAWRQGKYEVAMSYLDSAKMLCPAEQVFWVAQTLNAECRILLRQKQIPEAETVVARLLKEIDPPQSVSTYYQVKNWGEGFRIAYYNSQYQLADQRIEKAAKYLASLPDHHRYHGVIWNNYGAIKRKLGDVYGSQNAHVKALRFKQARLGDKLDKSLATAYLNLSTAHGNVGDLKRTLAVLDTVEIIAKRDTDYDVLVNLYLNKAYYDLDPRRQEYYFHEILKLEDSLSWDQEISIPKALTNLGITKRRRGEHLEAENYYHLALEALERMENPPRDYAAGLYHNIGILKYNQDDLSSAEEYFQKSLEERLAFFGPDFGLLSQNYSVLGVIEKDKGNVDLALRHFERALEIADENYGARHPKVGLIKIYLGKFLMDQNRHEAALKYILEANEILKSHHYSDYVHLALDGYRYAGLAYRKLNRIKEFEESHRHYLNLAGLEVDSLGKLSASDRFGFYPESALSAMEVHLDYYPDQVDTVLLELFLQLSKTSREHLFFESSQLRLQVDLKSLYGRLIDALTHAYRTTQDDRKLQMIFEIMESYRSVMVGATIRRHSKAQQFDVPDSMLQKEKDLIFKYERTYQSSQNENSLPGASSLSAKNKFDDLKAFQEEKDRFLDILRRDFPDYFHARYDHGCPLLEEVQARCENHDMAFVSMLFSDSLFHVLLITKDRLKLTTSSKSEIEVLANGILEELEVDYPSNLEADYVSNFTDFRRRAAALGDHLFGDQMTELIKLQSICFALDGQLSLLPMDILVVDSSRGASFRDIDYLLHHIDPHYTNSISEYLGRSLNTRRSQLQYVGFAPKQRDAQNGAVARSTTQESLLVYNTGEVKTASTYFQGKTFLGNDATLANFYEHAPSAGLLHLAMHGFVDDSLPLRSALLFQEDSADFKSQRLTMYEIAELNLNADLAVLSACHTDAGTLRAGEGSLSLRRAFQLAGCPQLVSTLWSVNDFAAEKIMSEFFDGIADWQTYASSLTAAKLAYLKTSSDFRAHPSFWAGFTYHGDTTSSIVFRSNWRLLWALSLLGIIFFLFVFLRKHFTL